MSTVHQLNPNEQPQRRVVEDKIVTRALADRWLTVGEYRHQRSLGDPHVNQLIAEMRANRFLDGIPIQFCQLPDGHYYLVNGKHTLEAIKAVGISIPLTIITYHVGTMEEVGEIYSRLDIGRPRTAYDRLIALGVPGNVLLGEEKLTKQETNSLIASIKMLLKKFRGGISSNYSIDKSADLWAEAITLEWKPAVQRMFEALEFAPNRRTRQKFLKAGIASVCLATMKSQKTKGLEFWMLALADDALRARHPAHQLAIWVIDKDHIKGGQSRQIIVSKHVAACWNKFYDGEDMNQVRAIDMGKSGLTIKGTPFVSRKIGARKK